jgi:hypothetical protein
VIFAGVDLVSMRVQAILGLQLSGAKNYQTHIRELFFCERSEHFFRRGAKGHAPVREPFFSERSEHLYLLERNVLRETLSNSAIVTSNTLFSDSRSAASSTHLSVSASVPSMLPFDRQILIIQLHPSISQDAVLSTRLLITLFKQDDIPHTLCTISGYAELEERRERYFGKKKDGDDDAAEEEGDIVDSEDHRRGDVCSS